MLTVDYGRLGVRAGDKVLDLGCGFGRHAYQAARLGAEVVAFDFGTDEVRNVQDTFGAMAVAGELDPVESRVGAVQGDALALPFADDAFDRVIASEILEHIPDDEQAMSELARVLRPAARWPSRCPAPDPSSSTGRCPRSTTTCPAATSASTASVSWSSAWRAPACRPPVTTTPMASTPYWWLKCLVGTRNDTHPAVAAYHRLLVWDIEKAPTFTRTAERILNPLVGKSLVVYLVKPFPATVERAPTPVGAGA